TGRSRRCAVLYASQAVRILETHTSHTGCRGRHRRHVQHRRSTRRQIPYPFGTDIRIDFDRNRGDPVFLMEFSRIADDLKGTGCHAHIKRDMGLAEDAMPTQSVIWLWRRTPCPLKALYGFGGGCHAHIKRYMGLARGAMPRWPLFQFLGHETRLM